MDVYRFLWVSGECGVMPDGDRPKANHGEWTLQCYSPKVFVMMIVRSDL
jgi:hypothetical protein